MSSSVRDNENAGTKEKGAGVWSRRSYRVDGLAPLSFTLHDHSLRLADCFRSRNPYCLSVPIFNLFGYAAFEYTRMLLIALLLGASDFPAVQPH